jgi:hypothetical protein
MRERAGPMKSKFFRGLVPLLAVAIGFLAIFAYERFTVYPDSAYRNERATLTSLEERLGRATGVREHGSKCRAILQQLGATCSDPYLTGRFQPAVTPRDTSAMCRLVRSVVRDISNEQTEYPTNDACEFRAYLYDTTVRAFGRTDRAGPYVYFSISNRGF